MKPPSSRRRQRMRYSELVTRRPEHRKPPALPPGSAVYAGDRTDLPTTLAAYSFDHQKFETVTTGASDECFRFHEDGLTTWIHTTGLRETEKVAQLGRHFGLHPLVIEDVLNAHGRSKLDQWGDWIFVTLRLLTHDKATSGVDNQHFSLYIAPSLVLTFCEAPTPVFDAVVARLREGAGRIRSMPADYLAWALLDAIVDHYFQIVDALDERLETIDDALADCVQQVGIMDLHRARAEVVALARQVRPVREIASQLSHSDSPVLTDATRPYFRDLYDHAVHVIDQVDDLREVANGLRDFFLATVNNRMNEIMKLLACVSTLFLPLTFLAGVYGMNFDVLPEKTWRWGYAGFWVVCLLISGGMLVWFRRKKWL